MATISQHTASAESPARERETTSQSVPSDLSLAAAPKLFTALPRILPEVLKISCKLQASSSENDRIILVSGLNGEESSSEFAAQLAAALSETDAQLVTLVDANFRNPSLHRNFGIEQQPGLTDVLNRTAPLDGAVRVVRPTLAVLPVGGSTRDSALLISAEFSFLLERQLRPRSRFIIVTSAPFGQFVDANLIASRVDGVVITMTAGRHRRSELLDLQSELEGLKSKIVGVVLCESE